MGHRVGRWKAKLVELSASGPAAADNSLRSRLATMRWLTPLPLAILLTVAGLLGGICEAGVLLVIVRVAGGLGNEQTEIAFSIGIHEFESVPVYDLLVVALLLTLARLACHLMFSYGAARSSSSVLTRLREDLLGTFLRSSWSGQATERQGLLQDYATSHVIEASRAAVFTAMALTAAISFATMLVSAFVISQAAAVTMAVGAVLLYLLFRPLTRMARTQANRYAVANSEYAVAVSEGVSLVMETSTFGVQEPVLRRIRARSQAAASRMFNVVALTRSLSGIYQNAALLALIGGLWWMASTEGKALAELGAVVIILIRALSYSQTFQVAQHSVNELLPFAVRTRDQIEAFDRDRRTSGSRPIPRIDSFRFDGVGYRYGDGVDVLTDVSFEVQAGEAIGVVGPSGAGKSTLAQILLRLRLSDQGHYLVNGIDAEEYSLDEWHRRVSFVPQEPHVLQGTVRENVAFFRDFDDDAIERACRGAHIHDDIVGWSDGYDTVLGSGSNLLSGGQRQRLCIARALVGSPDLLVLDEPTSALDMRSESAFQQTLEELHGSVTLVIIAHRVPTLRLCDRVMVLHAGQLEAFGTPAELVETNAFFAEALRLSRV